jgi:hypothetical protein
MDEDVRDGKCEMLTNDFIQELNSLSSGESKERYQGYLQQAMETLGIELQASKE